MTSAELQGSPLSTHVGHSLLRLPSLKADSGRRAKLALLPTKLPLDSIRDKYQVA